MYESRAVTEIEGTQQMVQLPSRSHNSAEMKRWRSEAEEEAAEMRENREFRLQQRNQGRS